MKSRLSILSLAVVALLAVSSLALAQPYGRGPNAWLAGVPQEKQEQVAKLYGEGRQKLYELESRKWAKQAELNALLASPKPDSSKIEALAKEIGNLSSMVYQERVALQQRIAKETGVNIPLAGGPGMGGGCGGNGYGAAGCPGGSGYGPGGCPMGRGGYGPQGGNQSALPLCCQTPGQTTGQAQ
ncbi:periplasmic heavy metal sensor [Fundidesulfovibrio terrae]|uniref:periplasmic heavy metal sensor n=1 Tax=Fundidesulfovibrio terrae TaxID=2922866 RepID=UPI001FAEBD97|nr:periplasmic heavy metal sensor [Fundidesulfovibrio terrae]